MSESARDNRAARSAWNKRPVGSQRSTSSPGDPGYFADLRAYRYRYETPFLPSFLDLPSLKGKDVLEIGVGNGIDAVEIALAGASYTGLDVTERHLELTRTYYRQRLGTEPRLIHADLLESGLPGPFDVIYSFGVLHHIPHEREYLLRARELIRDDGRLLIGVYSKYSAFNAYLLLSWLLMNRMRSSLDDWKSHVCELTELGSPVLVRIRSRSQMERLLRETGFEVVKYRKRGFVQRYLPLVGRYLRPDGPVLTSLGALAGWYHLFVCKPAGKPSGARL